MLLKKHYLLRLLMGILLSGGYYSMMAQPVLPRDPFPSSMKVNYIRTWDAKAPDQNPNTLITRPLREVQQTTQYFDGLGRPLQTVVKQGSYPTGGTAVDLVSPVVYDEFGRETLRYLPFGSTATNGTQNNGKFKLDPIQQQILFYNTQLADQSGEANVGGTGRNWAYSKTNYERSPLNRVENTYAPGVSWVGSESKSTAILKKDVQTKYYVNTSTDAVRIWNVAIAAPGSLSTYSSPGAYAAGTLYKTITIDENEKQVVEFKDKEGRGVLKKVQLTASADNGGGSGHTGWLCTYYIYDDLGNLRCVVQPKGVDAIKSNWVLTNANILDGLCFRYEYDERNRMIIKKVPDADPVYMVYDARDRLVMMQDGKQRTLSTPLWVEYIYDDLNRLRFTGFTFQHNGTSFAQHIANAKNSTTYPYSLATRPTNQNVWAVLEELYYDDYNNIPSGTNLTENLITEHLAYIYTNYNTAPLYAQPVVKSTQTRGLVTWKRTLIYGTTSFVYHVYLYDDKGRLIQDKYKNYEGGIDITTTQYNWSGQPLMTVTRYDKNIVNTSQFIRSYVITDYSYDDLGRLVTTKKKIQHQNVNNNALPSEWTVISNNQYDALGQLKKKELGKKRAAPSYNTYTTEPLEHLNYSYNIRGWLLGVNRSLLAGNGGAMPAMSAAGNYFGFDLGYDKLTSANTSLNYTAAQYNGNIAGMQWKSRGDLTGRVYNFTYDAANRLLTADFKQSSSGTTWNNTEANYTVNNIGYDLNGNITTMNQYGLKIAQPGNFDLDKLTYTYLASGSSYTNKLAKVADAVTSPIPVSYGDFRNGTNTDDDYAYNKNGSLTVDKNKGITGIEYWRTTENIKLITTSKGTIGYLYDFAGNKLNKVTTETSATVPFNGNNYTSKITTTTKYIGNNVYESKSYDNAALGSLNYTDRLLFVNHEEGRIRPLYNNPSAPNTPTGFVYDYFLKDHLGNIRMVLTDEYKQDIYPAATMEVASIATEELYYANLSNTQQNKPSWFSDPMYSTNGKVAKIKNTSGVQKIGPNVILKVMSGDSYSFRVASGWSSGSSASNSSPNVLADLLTMLTTGAAGASGGKVTPGDLQAGGSGLSAALTTFLGTQTTSGTKPKAYINWILLDEQFKVVPGKSGFEQVGGSGATTIHVRTNVPVTTNGYLYIYTSNEATNIDVFFDNLQVTHTRGQILEETHYYPFGLTMAGISSKALNNAPENKRKYNGIEFNEDLDLDIYDAYYRNLDPQTGRWWQIDPVTDGYEDISPYASMYNNPIRINDPLGNEGDDCCEGFIDGLVQLGKDAVTFTVAAANAFVTNQVGGVGRGDPNSFSDSHDAAVAQAGATFGDVLTLGGTVAATGGSVVVEGGTLGLASPAVVPLLGQQWLVAAPTAIKNLANTVNSSSSSSSGKGTQNPKVKESVEKGQAAHKDFSKKAEKKGWSVNPSLRDPVTGRIVKPDAVTKSGKPVELKPNTASGKAKGKRQLPKYERATGKKGRVVTYDPTNY